ncbi:MAG: MaoC family dehydratase [Nitratireductor sp.]|nr:MaoC family dehydratase [Nitratireductor sp.]
MPDFMQPGWEGEIGRHTFAADEIIAFARKFDPQPFHLSEAAARESLFGALCASGWHTAAMWMRKHRDFSAIRVAARRAAGLAIPEYGPSPGFRNLAWLKPVFAGDTITYFNTTRQCRASASRPGWHVLTAGHRALNQHGETVLTFDSVVLIRYPA